MPYLPQWGNSPTAGIEDPNLNQGAPTAGGGAPSGQPAWTPGASNLFNPNMDPYQAFALAVSSLGLTNEQLRSQGSNQVADYLNSNGMPGWQGGGTKASDWVSYNGQGYDYLHGGDNALQWLSDPGGSGGGGGGQSAGGGELAPWLSGSQGSDLFNLLMGRAKQSLDVNPNDPVIRGQTDAYNAMATRQERNYLADLAERKGPLANTGAETRMATESLAQGTAGFQAQLMQRELDARRQEIAQALQLGGQFLTEEQRMALQQQLADLSAGMQIGDREAYYSYLNSPMSFAA